MKTFAVLATITMLSIGYLMWDKAQPTAAVVAVAAALYFLETLIAETEEE